MPVRAHLQISSGVAEQDPASGSLPADMGTLAKPVGYPRLNALDGGSTPPISTSNPAAGELSIQPLGFAFNGFNGSLREVR